MDKYNTGDGGVHEGSQSLKRNRERDIIKYQNLITIPIHRRLVYGGRDGSHPSSCMRIERLEH